MWIIIYCQMYVIPQSYIGYDRKSGHRGEKIVSVPTMFKILNQTKTIVIEMEMIRKVGKLKAYSNRLKNTKLFKPKNKKPPHHSTSLYSLSSFSKKSLRSLCKPLSTRVFPLPPPPLFLSDFLSPKNLDLESINRSIISPIPKNLTDETLPSGCCFTSLRRDDPLKHLLNHHN